MQENQAARAALSFFTNITLRNGFNQWLIWAQERQEYGAKLHLAVQVSACMQQLMPVLSSSMSGLSQQAINTVPPSLK